MKTRHRLHPTTALDVSGGVNATGAVSAWGNMSSYYKYVVGASSIRYYNTIVSQLALSFNGIIKEGTAVTQVSGTTFSLNFPGYYTFYANLGISRIAGNGQQHFNLSVNSTGSITAWNTGCSSAIVVPDYSQGSIHVSGVLKALTTGTVYLNIVSNSGNSALQELAYASGPFHTLTFV